MKKYDIVFFTYPIVDMIVSLNCNFPINKANTYLINTIKNEPGGPANIVICGHRLGLSFLVVGYVGDDMYGEFLIKAYKSEGLNVSQIQTIKGFETRKVIILIDDDGNHTFISMVEGINKPYDNKEELIRQSKSLCFSGYYLAANTLRDEYMRIFRLAKKNDLEIFFDPGPLVDQIDVMDMNEVISNSSVIILNDLEAGKISGKHNVENSADFIAKQTSAIVVIKSGSKGCYISSEKIGLHRWFHGFPVNVVDTTAAGDSFMSAFMYGYLNDWDIYTIAHFSNAVGAAKVKKIGSGTQVPTFNEIVDVLESGGYSISDVIKRQNDFSNLKLEKKGRRK